MDFNLSIRRYSQSAYSSLTTTINKCIYTDMYIKMAFVIYDRFRIVFNMIVIQFDNGFKPFSRLRRHVTLFNFD